MDRVLGFILSILLGLGLLPSSSYSQGSLPDYALKERPKIVINGKLEKIPPDYGAAFVDSRVSRTMVPVRYLGERLGFTVTYQPPTNPGKAGSFLLDGQGKKVEMALNSKLATVEEWTSQGVYVKKNYSLGAPAQAYKDRTYVPLRFLSEVLGYEVTWSHGQVQLKVPGYHPGEIPRCSNQEDLLAVLDSAMRQRARKIQVIYTGGKVSGILPQIQSQLGAQVGLKNIQYSSWPDKKVDFTMTYRSTDLQAQRTQAYIKNWAQREIGPEDGDLLKILKIHKEVLEKTSYFNGEETTYQGVDVHTAESIVHHGTGVCQAYAQLVYLMCREVGLESYVVCGPAHFRSYQGPHAWNMVRLDGKWYHLDATWDDTNGTNPYMFFLKSDETMKETRSWQGNFPKALEDYSIETKN